MKKVAELSTTVYLFMVPIVAIISYVTSYSNKGVLYFILGLCIALAMIVNYKIHIKVYIMIYIIIVFLCINFIFQNWDREFLEQVKFLAIYVIIPIVCVSNIKDYNYFFNILYKASVIVGLVLILFRNGLALGYMTYGNYMVISFLGISNNFYMKKRKCDIYLIIIIYINILIFGSRGAFISASIVLMLTFMKGYYGKKKILISFIGILFLVCICGKGNLILIEFRNILNSMNIESYSVNKIILAYDEGIKESDSGRSELYNEAKELIISNKLKPMGLGYYQYKTGKVYPHNIIVELFIIFGFIAPIIIMLVCTDYIITYIKIMDKNKKFFILTLTIVSIVRLLLSSSLIIDIQFAVLVGFMLMNKKLLINKR